MTTSDVEYFRERAVVERRLAATAPSAAIAAVHNELARGYEKLVQLEAGSSASQDIPAKQD